MEGAVYLLCAATALLCALLLLRGFHRSRTRLLLWCGLCFLGLSLDNLFVFIDLILVPDVDLSACSVAAALVGAVLLLFGMIWEVR